MDRSLALALYLASTGPGPARPLGNPPLGRPLLWLHAPEPGETVRAMAVLAARLAAARPRLGLILTHPEGAPPATGLLPPGAVALPAPPDDPDSARAAIAAWEPDMVVLGDGPLSPALVEAAAEAGRHAFLVGASQPQIAARWGALPGLQRAVLRRLRRILVRDEAALRLFRRAGARPWRLEQGGALALSPGPLPHTAAERAVLAARIGARPVWLAVAVPEAEEAMVLAAQCTAQRLAHRLLLILVPADPARGPAVAAAAEEMGLGCARRSAEAEPEEDDQVYVADTEGELGLWYRLSPVTFMGGTLGQAGGEEGAGTEYPAARDPLEAAALGSVVIHGPAVGAHAAAFARLLRARASWAVPGIGPQPAPAAPQAVGRARIRTWLGGLLPRRPGTVLRAVDPAEIPAAALAEAVISLLAPDRVATLARAAWEVATEGAEATERVVDLVLAALDERDA